ncbi:uncharacterized protein LOC3291879 isoform X2 [Anopheles gambiae]|uniref:uncharacterized protein LOC3291879 isoform X2 n=1 Tax=Anopheles gambiae TaxID=7165 RepID=UPI002AC98972|nr:uncharacterized protein LOC3291879 isoform X2 [Anopheles gambiae]
MPNTMGHIKSSIVLVLFTQLLGHSEPKTIVFNSYSNEPAHQPESSRNVTSEQQPIAGSAHRQEASESSGRGFSSGGGSGAPSFPFSIHPDFLSKPVQVARPNTGYKTPKYIVYPSYSQNTPNSVPYYNAPVAMDRFAPGEAYGGTIYKLKKQKQPAAAPFASIPAASFNSPVSVPVPSALRPAASDNSPVSVPAPPSGPPSPPGPPPSQPDQPIFVPTPVPNSGDDAIGTISVGPGKPQYLPPSYSDNRPPMQQMAPMMAPQQMNKMPPQMAMPMASAPAMDGPPSGPPSGMDADYDHHHHDHHHHEHDFPYFTGFDHDHYPDIIFDHDHDHHHHHDEPTTTPAPPPPPPPAPETPRLKNYSYYYLSRTLWYVPLYFTLYFTVYVAILIIRSIARHKVNLPNQWVGNTRSFGSIRDLSNKEVQEKANMMAAFAMKQIEDFREKYL